MLLFYYYIELDAPLTRIISVLVLVTMATMAVCYTEEEVNITQFKSSTF